jgi:hypothetical protein
MGEVIPQQEPLLGGEGMLGLEGSQHIPPTLLGQALQGAVAHAEALPQPFQLKFTGGLVEGRQTTGQALQALHLTRAAGGLHHQAGKEGP